MLKVKRVRLIIYVFIISLCILGIFKSVKIINNYNNYSNIMNLNWEIKIPNDYKELYSMDSGPSVFGEGQRYHVFYYEDDKAIDDTLLWSDDKNQNIELPIKRLLKGLNISKEYIINFNTEYKYFYKETEDFSKIYIVYVPNSKIIYILEDIR